MIFALQFKTPDVVHSQLFMSEKDLDEAEKLVDKFVKNGEFVVIEFNTETQSCFVRSVK